jgi:predicted small lipoprotein YifL
VPARFSSHVRGMICLAAIVLTAAGCGGKGHLSLAPVAGTVTHDGKPLDHGKVVFFPEAGTPGPQAVGAIQSDGTFRMQTIGRDGAAVGRHRVLVHCRRPARPEEQGPTGVPPSESLIPRKYSVLEDSPLRFEVKEGDNQYSIALQ